jgi:hypothetical protein
MKKKRLLLAGALLGTMLASAQDPSPAATDDGIPKNKKGHEILPKEGDIGLGFNTLPILDMFLNSVSRSTSASVGSSNIVQYTQASNNQIVGKYFLDRTTAIRVRFGVNTVSGSMINRVQDAAAMGNARLGTQDDINAASLLRVEDKLTYNKNNWMISVGYEKRRGYRRLQGFYGGELGFGNTGASQTITYGNAFSDQYDVQYTSNFNSYAIGVQSPTANGRVTRDLTVNYRGGMRIGVRGFIGVEYFIFSKISIAAEYGWAYSITTRRAATSTREVYNNGQNGPEVFKETVKTDSREVMKGFAVDNNNGSVFSMNNTLNGNTTLSGGAGALTLHFYF